VFEIIGHHRPDGADTALSQHSRKPAAHGGHGFVQMLSEPRRGPQNPATPARMTVCPGRLAARGAGKTVM